MSYKVLYERSLQAERDFEIAIVGTKQSWKVTKRTLRFAMTPGRIIGSGLLTGFLTGMAAPLARMQGGAKMVQFLTSIIALVGATEAKMAAGEASDAAETASDTAVGVAEAVGVQTESVAPSTGRVLEARDIAELERTIARARENA